MPSRLIILGALLVGLTATFLQIWEGQGRPNLVEKFSEELNLNQTSIEEALTKLADKEILTPPPLRGSTKQSGNTLTISGVLKETNGHRSNNNLPPLKENKTLNQAATNKLADMFTQQYFEHVSPDGLGPADVVDNVGYQYMRVGENLALGNYLGDSALVQAWMDSPGHRANILEDGFSEIGIAVAVGEYEGQRTWLAVQTFGLPSSTCPAPSSKLQAAFDQKKDATEKLYAELNSSASNVDKDASNITEQAQEVNQLFTQGNSKTEAGNKAIAQGNAIAEETGSSSEAQSSWDKGEKLHAEAEALIEQAKDLQATFSSDQQSYQSTRDDYNQKVAQANQLNDEASDLADQLNAQIATYNTCANKYLSK